MIKRIVHILIPLTSFYLVFLMLANSFNYYDPLYNCYIKTEGNVAGGNEDTIRSALKRIKKADINEYKTVCKYVSRIIENHCLNSDPYFGYPSDIADGCYIRGSKTIYLKSNKVNSEVAIRERKDLIIKYGRYSERFWESI